MGSSHQYLIMLFETGQFDQGMAIMLPDDKCVIYRQFGETVKH